MLGWTIIVLNKNWWSFGANKKRLKIGDLWNWIIRSGRVKKRRGFCETSLVTTNRVSYVNNKDFSPIHRESTYINIYKYIYIEHIEKWWIKRIVSKYRRDGSKKNKGKKTRKKKIVLYYVCVVMMGYDETYNRTKRLFLNIRTLSFVAYSYNV